MRITRNLALGVFGVMLLTFTPSSFAQSNPKLEHLLDQMDKAAASFHTTEASFVWDQYQKVVDETDTQKGKVYFRRVGNEIQMAADITEPSPKYVLFTNSKIEVYQPHPADMVTVYNTSKNSEVESYLVLGFGGRGHDLSKAFEVTYLGSEKLGNLETEKLNLIPKSEKVRNNFDHIVLWIDPAMGISVQQQLFAPLSGDYRLAKYSDIKVDQKISDSVFRLKTTGKTKFVTP
jgi:outer membrane lipoprotein-sorting protein